MLPRRKEDTGDGDNRTGVNRYSVLTHSRCPLSVKNQSLFLRLSCSYDAATGRSRTLVLREDSWEGVSVACATLLHRVLFRLAPAMPQEIWSKRWPVFISGSRWQS